MQHLQLVKLVQAATLTAAVRLLAAQVVLVSVATAVTVVLQLAATAAQAAELA
jgi:hypothetical protein